MLNTKERNVYFQTLQFVFFACFREEEEDEEAKIQFRTKMGE